MFGGSLYLDIGERRARILKGAVRNRTFRIDNYANLEFSHPLGRDLDDDRNHEIGRQIAGFLEERGLSSRQVSVLMSREGMITRTARVPALDSKVLDEFILAAINEFLPVDLTEYAFDYRVMKTVSDSGNEKGYHELLLAAVPRYMVEQVMQVMESTRMYIRSLDILPNSILRLFSQTDYSDVAVLDVNRDGSRIAICEDGCLLLYADIPFNLSEEGEDAADLSVLIEETRGYLNFFAGSHQGRQVEVLHVVGDLAQREEIVTTLLDSALEIPVKSSLDEVLNFRWGRKTGPQPVTAAATMAGNLGMMLRKD
ncbi:MAG: type IV pilus biogenesis protein PilM [Syntrophomonadales bacterium]|jgi:hypothetical protein